MILCVTANWVRAICDHVTCFDASVGVTWVWQAVWRVMCSHAAGDWWSHSVTQWPGWRVTWMTLTLPHSAYIRLSLTSHFTLLHQWKSFFKSVEFIQALQWLVMSSDVWVSCELLWIFKGANNMKPDQGQQRRVSDVSGKNVRFVRNWAKARLGIIIISSFHDIRHRAEDCKCSEVWSFLLGRLARAAAGWSLPSLHSQIEDWL